MPASAQTRKRVTALLEDLVRIESVNPAFGGPPGGEARAAAYIGAFCEGLGLEVSYHDALPGRPNVVAKYGGDQDQPLLVFEGHLYTVNAGAMPDAFTPSLDEGKLYGRGACDVKGGIAAALAALECLVAREDLRINIEFVGAVDEEVGFQGVLAYVANAPRSGAAVVLEPTSLVPVIAHAGVLRGRLCASGIAAHSSRPERGENAIDKLTDALTGIRGWALTRTPNVHDLTGQTAFSVTTIRGGEAINVIPHECVAEFDWRLHPADDPARALTDLTDVLEGSFPAVEVSEVLLQDRGLETSPDATIVHAAKEACRRVTGATGVLGAPWGSDASKFTRGGDWQAIVLGPGSVEQAHTAREWVDVDEVATACDLYVEVALQYAEIA
jgi:acetylornithine deacetylase